MVITDKSGEGETEGFFLDWIILIQVRKTLTHLKEL